MKRQKETHNYHSAVSQLKTNFSLTNLSHGVYTINELNGLKVTLQKHFIYFEKPPRMGQLELELFVSTLANYQAITRFVNSLIKYASGKHSYFIRGSAIGQSEITSILERYNHFPPAHHVISATKDGYKIGSYGWKYGGIIEYIIYGDEIKVLPGPKRKMIYSSLVYTPITTNKFSSILPEYGFIWDPSLYGTSVG